MTEKTQDLSISHFVNPDLRRRGMTEINARDNRAREILGNNPDSRMVSIYEIDEAGLLTSFSFADTIIESAIPKSTLQPTATHQQILDYIETVEYDNVPVRDKRFSATISNFFGKGAKFEASYDETGQINCMKLTHESVEDDTFTKNWYVFEFTRIRNGPMKGQFIYTPQFEKLIWTPHLHRRSEKLPTENQFVALKQKVRWGRVTEFSITKDNGYAFRRTIQLPDKDPYYKEILVPESVNLEEFWQKATSPAPEWEDAFSVVPIRRNAS